MQNEKKYGYQIHHIFQVNKLMTTCISLLARLRIKISIFLLKFVLSKW
ncbi:hypothetical protein MGWOODY_Mmi371 [hydrothermal vent metagenome]|uniref:Uncharacterized protein n=1 Tax=hydrothermal vent metagenome TaxID=652676 RepID=A0A160VET7_9ZZZZ